VQISAHATRRVLHAAPAETLAIFAEGNETRRIHPGGIGYTEHPRVPADPGDRSRETEGLAF
jgi:hypothetical protein